VLGIGLVVLVLGMTLNIGRGDFPISVGDVLSVLAGGGDPGQRFIVLDLRLPRSLTGLLVGAALAVAGAITQSIARNPLASPDMIGFTAGANAAAVCVIVLGGASGWFLGAVGLPVAALAGGLLSAFAIYGLAWRRGVQGFRLVLVGIGVDVTLTAVVHWLIIVGGVTEAARAYVWLNGSLNGRGWEHVWPVAIAVAVLLPLVAALARPMQLLEMGDDTAEALGVSAERARRSVLVLGVALTAIATASAGPIVFVALAAPQIARRLTRATGPGAGAAALTGSVLLLAADVAAQRLFPSTPLPVGVMTGVLGGLYLIWLLRRQARKGHA
jgi:iron complex transport system permease protein